MQIMDVTWGRAARVWWSIFWRTFLITALLAVVFGFLTGFLIALAGLEEKNLLWSQVVGIACAVVGGIWAVKKVLEKEYRTYRLVLIPSTEAQMQQSLDN
ncbi:hypothetical protein [Methylophaga sp. OBS1]|uniref:hypothetical protein n=1 Tax=Methylophaga sp. OBS1 TaxID=2991933 RepID=UPI0022516B3C|nr:hypothetical protein [Methylophaga sp. OBS1]MCX4191150.1 hypothetical protein [Methylophaga sp. OBS1]